MHYNDSYSALAFVESSYSFALLSIVSITILKMCDASNESRLFRCRYYYFRTGDSTPNIFNFL